MTQEEEKYHSNFLDLFMHEGWKQFVEDNKAILDDIDLSSAKDWDDFIILRTEKEVRERIHKFEELERTLIEELKNPTTISDEDEEDLYETV